MEKATFVVIHAAGDSEFVDFGRNSWVDDVALYNALSPVPSRPSLWQSALPGRGLTTATTP